VSRRRSAWVTSGRICGDEPLLLLVEGPDDLAALRELLVRRYGYAVKPRAPSQRFPGKRSAVLSRNGALGTEIAVAEGKDNLTGMAAAQIRVPSP